MRWLVAVLPLLPLLLGYSIEWTLARRYPTPPPGSAIVLSGASSGIGRDVAQRFAGLGFTVLAGCRSIGAEQSIRQLKIPNLLPLSLDVTDASSVAAAARTVQTLLDQNQLQLVGLVNNAGIGINARAGGGGDTVEAAHRTLDVNVLGILRVSEAFLPLLQRPPGLEAGAGRVVNIGSLAGRAYRPNDVAYVASKHAVEGLSDSMRLDLAPHGISVSLIQPGFVRTEMCAHAGCVAFPNTTTTPAIEHALLDPFPRTRYAVSETYGLPASLSIYLSALLPDRLKDVIVLLFESNGR